MEEKEPTAVTPCWSVSSSNRQDCVSYEVRRYDAGKYAAISSEGRSFDQVTGELVRKLLMYIGGSNDQGEQLNLIETHTHRCYYTQTTLYYYLVCTIACVQLFRLHLHQTCGGLDGASVYSTV